jgi:hypothetical protein
MNYTSLVAPKGTAGSIADWIGYAKLSTQADVILTEAQSIIFQSLRVREMRTRWVFGMPVSASRAALPARFLDPIGRLVDTTFGLQYRHKSEGEISERRAYQALTAGSFGNNPFTTTSANSGVVTATLAAHGLTQGSDITISGATSPLDGLTINGTFPVTNIVSVNSFQFDTDGSATLGGVNDGGAAATYTANQLIAGSPSAWAIWDECVQFDQAFDTATTFRLPYFRSPALLSLTNQTNFLTSRYPLLVRKACEAAAADFMKDDNEYQKALTALSSLIQATNAESDLMYRGAELDTETP